MNFFRHCIFSKFSLLIAFFACVCCGAFAAPKEIPLPMIKIPSRVQSLDWNSNSSLFSHTEGNIVTVRDGGDYSRKYDVGINGGKIIRLKFAATLDGAIEQLLMFSDASELSVFRFPETAPTIIERLPATIPPPLAEFSNDGNFIAISRADGDIDTFFQLYLTRNITRSMLKNPLGKSYENTNIASLAFSKDSAYLAVLQSDGHIAIIRLKDKATVATLAGSDFSNPCVIFGNGETLLTILENRIVQLLDFTGKRLLRFAAAGKIRSMTLSADGENVIVLTKDNQFHFYSLEDGTHLGYIPAWNETEVSCYSFSEDDERLLVGHDDGSIYILNVEDVFYLPNERPNYYRVYMADGDIEDGYRYRPEKAKIERVDRNLEKIIAELDENEVIVRKTAHNIETRVGYKYSTADYYSHGAQLSVGYINDWLVKKFYFGALFEIGAVFPNSKFPYEYIIGDVVLANPFLFAMDLKLLVGKEWHPFSSAPDLKFITEVNLGGGFNRITSFSLGSGKFAASLFGGGTVGFGWKGISLYVTVTYDTITKFNIAGGLAFKIRINIPRKTSENDIDESEIEAAETQNV